MKAEATKFDDIGLVKVDPSISRLSRWILEADKGGIAGPIRSLDNTVAFQKYVHFSRN